MSTYGKICHKSHATDTSNAVGHIGKYVGHMANYELYLMDFVIFGLHLRKQFQTYGKICRTYRKIWRTYGNYVA
jgi:hypothetical protein